MLIRNGKREEVFVPAFGDEDLVRAILSTRPLPTTGDRTADRNADLIRQAKINNRLFLLGLPLMSRIR